MGTTKWIAAAMIVVTGLLAAFAAVSVESRAVAQEANRSDDGLTTRVYRIPELLEGSEGGERAEKVEKLVDILCEACPDASWERGTIRNFQYALIVKQTEANLERIEQLLDRLRETAHSPQRAEREHLMRVEMLEVVREMTFEPTNMGLLAVNALREIPGMEPEEIAKHLEKALERTETLGLRNAIRLALHDMYRHTDQTEKYLASAVAMLAENDEAAMAEQEENDDEDDEDENEKDHDDEEDDDDDDDEHEEHDDDD